MAKRGRSGVGAAVRTGDAPSRTPRSPRPGAPARPAAAGGTARQNGSGASAVPPETQAGPPSGERPRRSWIWLVVLPLLGALLFAGAGVLVNRQTGPTYAAEALMTVLPTDTSAPVSQPVADIWVQIGTSGAVLAEAASQLGVDPEELAARLELVPATASPVIAVRVTTTDAERSAVWADVVAEVLLGRDADGRVPGYALKKVTDAVIPATGDPLVSPLLLVAAGLLGALAGLVSAQWLRRRRGA